MTEQIHHIPIEQIKARSQSIKVERGEQFETLDLDTSQTPAQREMGARAIREISRQANNLTVDDDDYEPFDLDKAT